MVAMTMMIGWRRATHWTEELDEELRRLFGEARAEQMLLPGCDEVHVVENRLSDQTKSRKQIVVRLIDLGLMRSLKELKRFVLLSAFDIGGHYGDIARWLGPGSPLIP